MQPEEPGAPEPSYPFHHNEKLQRQVQNDDRIRCNEINGWRHPEYTGNRFLEFKRRPPVDSNRSEEHRGASIRLLPMDFLVFEIDGVT